MNPKVDSFMGRSTRWQAEMVKLRNIALDCHLDEVIRWGKPTYAIDGGNVAIIQPFKDYVALMFFKGALLKDERGILHHVGPNSQAARQLRFTALSDMESMESDIKDYIKEAIEHEKAGRKVSMKTTADHAVPDELQQRLDGDPALKEAFEGLTPGRQRSWLIHVAGAKQAKTRASRVEKAIPRIMDGMGFNE